MTSLLDILYSDPTLEAADRALEARAKRDKPRTYLGMSQIGEACERKLWYSFRWAGREAFDHVTLKRFADGHRTEDLVISRLKMVEGLDVMALAPGGGQFRVIDHGGHFSGHLDGTAEGLLQAPKTRHVLEVKCVSDKKFAEFKKAVQDLGEKQALRKWNPVYYAQAQCYMHYTGLHRHWIVVATPGGRDWTSARTEYNKEEAERLVVKARRIIESQEPLDKISNKPDWWECRFCAYQGICHKQEMPDRTCRTCLHAETMSDGRWHCQRFGKMLTPDEQLDGCPCHKYLPKLVPGEVIDATEKGVTYKMPDGTKWYDGE